MSVISCHDPDTRRALKLFVCLTRASESFQRGALEAAPLPGNLTLSQFAVLEALYHVGPLTQTEVGRKVLKTKGNVSLVARRLADRGLIRCTTTAGDRRSHRLELSEAGRKLMDDYFPRIAEGFTRRAEVLTAEEQETLTILARKLGLNRRKE